MKITNTTELRTFLFDNMDTLDCADMDIQIDDWTVDWSGGSTLNIEVEPEGATVESCDGNALDDVFYVTGRGLSDLLRGIELESKSEEECITADDVRDVLNSMYVLSRNPFDDLIKQRTTDAVVQDILERASRRRAGE